MCKGGGAAAPERMPTSEMCLTSQHNSRKQRRGKARVAKRGSKQHPRCLQGRGAKYCVRVMACFV